MLVIWKEFYFYFILNFRFIDECYTFVKSTIYKKNKNLLESQIIVVTTTTTGEHKDLPTVGPLGLCARCSWHQGWRGGDQQVYQCTYCTYIVFSMSVYEKVYDFCWSMYIPKYMHKAGREVTNRFIDVHIVHILYSVCLYM